MRLLIELEPIIGVTRLEGFELPAVVDRAALRDRPDRRDKTIAIERLDLGRRENLRHASVLHKVPRLCL